MFIFCYDNFSLLKGFICFIKINRTIEKINNFLLFQKILNIKYKTLC